MGFEFALLKAFNETRVADVGGGIEVRDTATRDHLVDLGEVGIFPMLADPLAIGFLDGSIIHSLFEIDSLIWIEGLVEMFVDECGDMGSERHCYRRHATDVFRSSFVNKYILLPVHSEDFNSV